MACNFVFTLPCISSGSLLFSSVVVCSCVILTKHFEVFIVFLNLRYCVMFKFQSNLVFCCTFYWYYTDQTFFGVKLLPSD